MNKESEMGDVKHNNRAFDDLVAEMRRDHPSEMALAGEWAAGWADGVKHGAAQIDTLRAEAAELAAALESIDTLVSEVIGADSGDRRILGKIEDEISAAIAKHRGE